MTRVSRPRKLHHNMRAVLIGPQRQLFAPKIRNAAVVLLEVIYLRQRQFASVCVCLFAIENSNKVRLRSLKYNLASNCFIHAC